MVNSDKDFEKSNQCAFDAYCKVILRNEARDAYDQRKRKTKVSMLIESVYVHKRDPKSGTQAIDITWKF